MSDIRDARATSFVRENIYINADLTPAEAKASRALRCARRQRKPIRYDTIRYDTIRYEMIF